MGDSQLLGARARTPQSLRLWAFKQAVAHLISKAMCTFTNDFIYQLFSKFHKNPHLSRNEPGFWLILFRCPAVKRSHWRKFFPHRPLVLEQQLDLLPKVPTGHTMVFGWPRILAHPRTVLA